MSRSSWSTSQANKRALEQAIKVGLALHCTINTFSKFDRKNYMYPDLFKGYQITQYEIPICENGYVDIERRDGSHQRIGIIRAHQEEDTAKSLHERDYSLIDGNKAGVPLLEIVSAPDMTSMEDASIYAQQLYNTLRFIGVSDCDMEKGQMRFDVNINVAIEETNKKGDSERVATPIVEIKNLNSFRSMERAIEYEVERQCKEYEKTGIAIGKGTKTTRGWSDDRGETYLLRSKEEAEDYRYFPDPDLPPVVFSEGEIEQIKQEIGMLPSEIYRSFIDDEGFSHETALFFSTSRMFYEYLQQGLKQYDNTKNLANWIKGDFASKVYEMAQDTKILEEVLPVSYLTDMLTLVDEGAISNTAAKTVLDEMVKTKKHPKEIVKEKGLSQVSDAGEIETIVKQIIEQNPDAVEKYRSGKTSIVMFLVGLVMREMKGKEILLSLKRVLNIV